MTKRVVLTLLCALGLTFATVGSASAHHRYGGERIVERVVHIDSKKCRKYKRKAHRAHSPHKRAKYFRKYNRKCTYVEAVRVPVRPRPVIVKPRPRPRQVVVVAPERPREVVVVAPERPRVVVQTEHVHFEASF